MSYSQRANGDQLNDAVDEQRHDATKQPHPAARALPSLNNLGTHFITVDSGQGTYHEGEDHASVTVKFLKSTLNLV